MHHTRIVRAEPRYFHTQQPREPCNNLGRCSTCNNNHNRYHLHLAELLLRIKHRRPRLLQCNKAPLALGCSAGKDNKKVGASWLGTDELLNPSRYIPRAVLKSSRTPWHFAFPREFAYHSIREVNLARYTRVAVLFSRLSGRAQFGR